MLSLSRYNNVYIIVIEFRDVTKTMTFISNRIKDLRNDEIVELVGPNYKTILGFTVYFTEKFVAGLKAI